VNEGSEKPRPLRKDWRVRVVSITAAVIGFLIGLVVFGAPWRLPPAWGDIPTWLLALGAAVTSWYAVRAFSEQHREVAAIERQVEDGQEVARQQAKLLELQGEQLETQRQQLAEQRDLNERQSKVLELQAEDLRESILERKREAERTAKRDELLDKQIAEAEQRSLTYERQQAEEIGLKRSSFTAKVPGSEPPASHQVYLAEVANDSRRPIRNVACRIEPEPGDTLQPADRAGFYAEAAAASSIRFSVPRFLDLSEGTNIQLIGVGETAAFAFAVETAEHPKAHIMVRFTDDIGLHWLINHDLHLEKLDNRDDW
jgi:hypothetical protein